METARRVREVMINYLLVEPLQVFPLNVSLTLRSAFIRGGYIR